MERCKNGTRRCVNGKCLKQKKLRHFSKKNYPDVIKAVEDVET